jgi:hypothetical protein
MNPDTTSGLYHDILRRFEKVRKKENRLSLLSGLQLAILIILGLVLGAVVCEEIFLIGIAGRTVLFLFVLAGIATVLAWFIVRPLLRLAGILPSINNATISGVVGNHFPSIRDRLLDAMQMYEQREKLQQHYSLALIDASFADLHAQIQQLDFSEAVRTGWVRRLRKYVAYAFGVAVLVLVISPSGFFTSLYRIAHFQESFASPLPVRFVIDPGNVNAIRGQSVPITVRTEGKAVSSISFNSRQQGQVDFDHQELKRQGEIFHTELSNIKSSTEYYASVEDVQSDKFTITVFDRPLIRSFQIKLTPPAYTRISSTLMEENAGDISVYPGTTIGLQLNASKVLSEARLLFNDSTSLALTTAGKFATGVFTAKKRSTYRFILKDSEGLQNLDPVEYTVTIVPDEYPTAEIVTPGRNIDLTESMKIALFIRIKDDFGFSRLRLAWRLAQSKYEKPGEEVLSIDIPLQSHQASPAEVMFNWDLTAMHLVPEDVIAYYAEVFDNDNVNGPKSGRSQTYLLRLPSLEEVFSDVSQSHDQSLESMQDAAKEAEQLKRDIDDLRRDVQKNNEKPDWQQQKKAEEMLHRYEAMKKKLEETSQKLDEAMKQMDENKLLSDKTMEKYQELQKLMDELKNPELQEALKKLQESMKQPTPEQMKQAMDQLKMSEEQFRQSLERTIELLKRIHIEQKVDELIKRAQEMQKQQEALRDETKKSNPSDQQKRNQLAKKQEDMKQQADSLKKETGDLQKKMEEFPKEMPVEEMEKARKQLEQSQVGQKMQQAAQQMQSGDMESAQQQQQQSEEAMDQFSQAMQQVQKTMQENQMKQVVNELRKQLQNVVELSKQEEQLKDETKNLDPNSRRFREDAQKQDDVRSGLNNVGNKLGELSKKSFAVNPEMSKELGSAMREMDDAMQQMEGRNPGGSSSRQADAMGSLNRAAMMMKSTLNSMMQGSQGGSGMAGLMARLGQLSGMQGGINQQTKDAMGMGQGQGFSPEQQSAYSRLAGQQSSVQKTLKQLTDEAKNSGDFSKLLGDLDDIAKQMSEVQTDLEQKNVNPNTIQKQDRILSRLLDSQRSMRERDYEKRRKAETGKDVQRPGPTDLDLSTQEGKNKLREELLKVLEGKYSKDYETLIKKYFEQLDKEEVKDQQ